MHVDDQVVEVMRTTGHRARGQALAEFALVLPIFLVLVVGLFDFGRAIYTSNAIGNAARVATRIAIVDQNVTRIQQTASDEAPGSGLAAEGVDVTFTCTHQIQICMATVTVTTEYSAATPLIERLVGPITLTATSEMPLERIHDSSAP